MGCAGSKLDDLPAVALCHSRTDLLAAAIRHRYTLADAHDAYARSLRSVGAALHRLLDASASLPPPPNSPVLPLPPQRKGDPMLPPSPSPSPPQAAIPSAHHHHHHHHSRSHSGSHIHFHSDSDETGSESNSPLHSTGSSPIHHHHHLHPDHQGETYVNVSYARSQPAAPSVTYEQRPQSPEAVYASASGVGGAYPPYFSGYGYSDQNPSSYGPYAYAYNYPPSYPSYGGFFGSGSPPPTVPRSPPEASSSKAAPPPPPPASGSTWDFLNPFESFESYHQPYTPSRSSKEVREEEGIPDLEDEEQEVVKEAYVDEKSAAATSSAAAMLAGEYSRKSPAEEEIREDPPYNPRLSEAAEDEEDGDAPVVEKNVVADNTQPQKENAATLAAPRKYHGITEVAAEIKVQFERASDTIGELSKMLEVGKQPYNQRHSVYHVSPRMVCVMGPSISDSEDLLVFQEDKTMGSGSLSSTLQKLYIWEKKLYEEVKAEEKMRVLHDRKCKRLKHLDERGAEAHKIDSTQAIIRKLSTKIRIAIQVIESISKKINKLRDEELWLQINELIQGFIRMWKVMLECHRTQCQAISEAKNLDSISSSGILTDIHMESMLQFELEMLEWIGNFSEWIIAQKNYVKALNGWLILCLHYEPEETPDGIIPFSPGRLGAPPVFVICNYWSQAIDRISEKEVIDSMKAFATSVRHIWELQNVEQRQRLMANSDMDRWLRTRERETQKINRAVDELNKKLVIVTGQDGVAMFGQVVNHNHDVGVSSMQVGLGQVFEAMEKFIASSMKAYEELHARSEEERLARENAKVP